MLDAISNRCFAIVVVMAVLVLQGCSSPNTSDAPTTSPSPATAQPISATIRPAHAECLVCKKNADLACVDVDVDKDTPSYVYNGRTYYFCSDECRNDFAKNPAKYLGR